MTVLKKSISNWEGIRIGITGAKGALGKAISKQLRAKGAFVIGISHSPEEVKPIRDTSGPQKWVYWQCGQENQLDNILGDIDILILNHGINPKKDQSITSLRKAIEINALSNLNLIERFENLNTSADQLHSLKEIWVNTSEAEIQPALSPGYEISKRLIGELVSIYRSNQSKEIKNKIKLRKLILGPFKSELNPIGIMNSDFVAKQIIFQASLNLDLIIVTPNPLTYLLMPIVETARAIYYFITR